jgi:hypothetical protein
MGLEIRLRRRYSSPQGLSLLEGLGSRRDSERLVELRSSDTVDQTNRSPHAGAFEGVIVHREEADKRDGGEFMTRPLGDHGVECVFVRLEHDARRAADCVREHV